MNYHDIRVNDMLNGDGLRVVLFISGCDHHCNECHNPETWDVNSGIEFTEYSMNELLEALDKNYISGLTLSGGDPLKYDNLPVVYNIVKTVKNIFSNKTIWLYTGFDLTINDFDTSADIGWDNGNLRNYILSKCDVVCDGKFIKELSDVNYPWVGSTNQRVIDVQKTLQSGSIVLYNT